MKIDRRRLLLVAGAVLITPASANAANRPLVTIYKDPSCGCCGAWADHITKAGFPTKIIEAADINAVKVRLGVPADVWSCHTAEIDGYILEGHVPVPALERLLTTRPSIRGLAVPGMPLGSPGMEVTGTEPETYDVVAFGSATPTAFMRFHGASSLGH
ncbi:DUF411 domain-containing protein [Phyllobacterium salinisoli]|uniref:DUF411 domain-containing protein n=1 Tax=Phyllobacterium salinisoli TaxID=1899321 RepID=A0A368JZ90_9HYPH|nr:DUF411 domain-containing protein [Phyllobacterium salinisoli]RCS21513.1 DUF411 domain-containing protein [Phyllobacterium salinisoli]